MRKTEKEDEEEDEVDLMFADVDIVDESAQPVLNIDRQFGERFTPVCTPTRNRKDLLGDLKIFFNLESI